MNNKLTTPVVDEPTPTCASGKPHCDIISMVNAMRDEIVELSEQVRTDNLTGLFNFRHFIQALTLEMERTRRTNLPTALIMMDLDYFKNVNDTWGHAIGNEALTSSSQVLRQTTRQLDILCRYGGEEFAIILPSVDMIVSKQVAERIRAGIETTPLVCNGATINLTASLGVALFDAKQPESLEDFVKRADHYLYQAKQSGRNCIRHEVKQFDDKNYAVSQEEKDALTFIGSND